MARHSSPRRMAAKQRRMNSWESVKVRNGLMQQQKAPRRMRQAFPWRLSEQAPAVSGGEAAERIASDQEAS